MGTLPQKELYKMYATYVSSSKAQFFKKLGLGAIQGEREGLRVRRSPSDRLDLTGPGSVC